MKSFKIKLHWWPKKSVSIVSFISIIDHRTDAISNRTKTRSPCRVNACARATNNLDMRDFQSQLLSIDRKIVARVSVWYIKMSARDTLKIIVQCLEIRCRSMSTSSNLTKKFEEFSSLMDHHYRTVKGHLSKDLFVWSARRYLKINLCSMNFSAVSSRMAIFRCFVLLEISDSTFVVRSSWRMCSISFGFGCDRKRQRIRFHRQEHFRFTRRLLRWLSLLQQ